MWLDVFHSIIPAVSIPTAIFPTSVDCGRRNNPNPDRNRESVTATLVDAGIMAVGIKTAYRLDGVLCNGIGPSHIKNLTCKFCYRVEVKILTCILLVD